MKRIVIGVVAAALALAGCAAPSDGDGELVPAGALGAPPKSADATPVVVDTDLGGDDLVALAFLLRHPDVDVRAITVAGAGLVGCDPGVDIVADLLTALALAPVPVACTREQGEPGGAEFPQEWRQLAATGTGIPRPASTLLAERVSAAALIGRLARRVDGLVVVALGPMTTLARLAATAPASYERLAGVHAMGGSVDGPPVDGVAEWNAAADPAAFQAVLAAGVPLTIVPEDSVPTGTPELLTAAPGVAPVAATVDYPAWWDLATAAALVAGTRDVEPGEWALDPSEPGRLVRAGDGPVRVVRSLDAAELEAAYGLAFR